MASYFDPTKDADKKLLHSSVRDHSELEAVAEQVEHEVINHYREERHRAEHDHNMGFHLEHDATPYEDNPIETNVMLSGYKQDADEAEQHFREAMRRTIAQVVSYILRNYDNDPGLTSKSRGDRSWTWDGAIPTVNCWPKGWKRRLSVYDNTETLYHL